MRPGKWRGYIPSHRRALPREAHLDVLVWRRATERPRDWQHPWNGISLHWHVCILHENHTASRRLRLAAWRMTAVRQAQHWGEKWQLRCLLSRSSGRQLARPRSRACSLLCALLHE